MIKLNDDESRNVLFFQQITEASARDCVRDEDSLVFVVNKGEIGKAIGKNGKNINLLEKLLKKKVKIVESSEDLESFSRNIFSPVELKINVDQGRVIIEADKKNRKYIIGKEGKKIKIARILIKRHFGIENVKVI